MSQPPEKILNHTYEYTVREDTLLALEYHNPPVAQGRALLRFPSPLADDFRPRQGKEIGPMDDIRGTVETRVESEAAKQQQHQKLEKDPER